MATNKRKEAFSKAFRQARNAGETKFTFQGKFYDTRTGSEMKKGMSISRQAKESQEMLKKGIEKKSIKKIPTKETSISDLIMPRQENKEKKKKPEKEPRYKRRIERITERGNRKESKQADKEQKQIQTEREKRQKTLKENREKDRKRRERELKKSDRKTKRTEKKQQKKTIKEKKKDLKEDFKDAKKTLKVLKKNPELLNSVKNMEGGGTLMKRYAKKFEEGGLNDETIDMKNETTTSVDDSIEEPTMSKRQMRQERKMSRINARSQRKMDRQTARQERRTKRREDRMEKKEARKSERASRRLGRQQQRSMRRARRRMEEGGMMKEDNMMMDGGMTKNKYEDGGLKPIPEGNKGKGLRKLPKKVRNKMNYMKEGGSTDSYDNGGFISEKKEKKTDSRYRKKFRKARDKYKKNKKKLIAKGKPVPRTNEVTFKYRPEGSSIFKKRKVSTIETRSEKKKRLENELHERENKKDRARRERKNQKQPLKKYEGAKGESGMITKKYDNGGFIESREDYKKRKKREKAKQKLKSIEDQEIKNTKNQKFEANAETLAEYTLRKRNENKVLTAKRLTKNKKPISPPKGIDDIKKPQNKDKKVSKKYGHGGKIPKKGGIAIMIIANKKSKK